MARPYVRDTVPLSRFGVLVAQLESIAASAAQKPPEPLLCFDLLSHLLSAIDEETKESLLSWQRKCEDAIYSLLILGARRPVRHLASIAMARIIYKGDSISIYSRISSLQGFLSDVKKGEPHCLAGAAQCLGELYRYFGGKITSGLLETTMIASKLMKFNEDFVRQEALHMLQNALEGCGAGASSSAYAEAYRLITRFAIGDKSFVVRIAAARCLKAFANIGGPGLGIGELDSSASYCVKALEDPLPSVRDAFSEALASLLALGMNPEAQVQPKGKGPFPPAKKLEGGLQKHLAQPFTKAKVRLKGVRIGVTLSWVFFLQAIHLKYQQADSELQNFALQVIDMLREDTIDAHALACVLYILRVGVTDQMTEPNQRSFLVLIANQLQSPDGTPSMKIAVLRTLSYTLKTLGEVPSEFKEVLGNTVVGAVSHSSPLVRIEAALTLRALAEVDPTCVGGLISFGVNTLSALRENVSFEKGNNLKLELDNLHGQATILAALVSVSPKLSLGYPTRLPKSVLEVSKKMLSEPSRNPVVVTVEEEAGWLLLSSLLASMPKEELEDEVFDILSLWAAIFSRDPEREINQTPDLATRISVWSAAVDALTAFIRCFISTGAVNDGVLLQPVLVYLSRVLSCISTLVSRALPNMKSAVNILIIRILMAYQSLPNPMAYKNDHPQIIQLCSTPFRDASGCEESSCLRLLLDKRDAWLGPWTPGRDWFEDELRAFEGGKDGLLPCVWENEPSIFPQPDSVNKTLVNQKLLCFAIMFASQDSSGMLSLLGIIEQCLKAGKRQQWHSTSVTNICVGLLAGLKYLLALRHQPLGPEILSLAQSIFQSILAEGDICASQRRASAEGLGLLARLGNDIFTAKMTRSLLGDLNGVKVIDPNYAGSVSVALGCIHRSAGGMALSTLVPATVRSVASLAKSPIAGVQVWSLHGLLLTIEAAGLSFVSHVQAMLGLALEILLSENGWVDVQQGVARLINAIIAVLGPELAPDSIFFSRCKSIVAEISTWPETATMLESARFTQQLVLFAPQAVSVHSHVQILLPTLSSRQPALRHLAISTLRHLIEKDAVSVINEQIEDNLFHMLDEETDSEIGNLIRATIMRLLYASCPSCPAHWMSVCRNMVLATSTRRNTETNMNLENDSRNGDSELNFGDDDETMVSSSKEATIGQGHSFDAFSVRPNKDKHLRYRTRVFAAECLSHLPTAVGSHPAHFDLPLASKQVGNAQGPGRWLVLHLQELISLAYQISTIQFENMQPIGVGLLSTIIDKFETVPDPEFPGHLLLEQYQAQLVSAVRSALGTSSSPILLESGLQLATKILMSGMISGDQVAVKRIFSLISRPLNDFNNLYYPSFAEWVACKIKIRLLAAHASLKCYVFTFLRRHDQGVPNEHQALLPMFSENSNVLGKHWIQILKDLSYVCLGVPLKKTKNPFLDGIHSAVVLSKLGSCLEEAWPVMLQALALDAVPLHSENISKDSLVSGYDMVKLESEEYRFLWGFVLLVLFQGQHPSLSKQIIPSPPAFKLCDTVLPVFQFLSSEIFFSVGYLTADSCQELLQVFSYFIYMDNPWGNLVISVLLQIVENCPEDFLVTESFAHLSIELCLAHLFKLLHSPDAISSDHRNWEELISPVFTIAETLVRRFKEKKQLHTVILAFLSVGYKGIRVASTKLCFSKFNEFVKTTKPLLKKLVDDKSKLSDDDDDDLLHLRTMLVTCLNVAGDLTKDCIEGIHLLRNKRSDLRKLLQTKLAFSLEETISFAELAHKIGSFRENDSNLIFFSMVKYCAKWFQTVLTDSNIQVQAIGLQVLESFVQHDTNIEDNAFLMFLIGELVGDIFTIIQKVLKSRITKESVVIAGECLRILLLLHKQSKARESQRLFMNLLLEAVVMVFSASKDGLSQGVNDIRSTALKLVTLLAQIPSSAAQFKEVMLSMSATHRLQLQGIIRASVTQDLSPRQAKPAPPSFEIKLPLPQPAATEQSDQIISVNEDGSEEDEDDWDTFQSFPASASGAGTESNVDSVADEPGLDQNPPVMDTPTRSDDESQTEKNEAEDQKVGEEMEENGAVQKSAENTSLEDAEA